MGKEPCKLVDVPVEEVALGFWRHRLNEREKAIKQAMDWAIYAFLFYEQGLQKAGRNHEIEAEPSISVFCKRLQDSASKMQSDRRQKVDMRSVCWWDVQKQHHEFHPKAIEKLAVLLHESILPEAVHRLVASGYLFYQHDYWRLSAVRSRKHIQSLKCGRGRAGTLCHAS